MKLTRSQLAGLAIVASVIIAGKLFYRHATADELRWILAPTAKLVSWVSGGDFVYESGVGYADPRLMFVIAPACAGLHFALAAFLALSLGSLPVMTSPVAVARRLVTAAALAYVATIVVNTVRIAIAIPMHASPDAHRLEGTIVYLAGLLGLYAIATGIERGRRSWLAIPLGAYIVITLVLPALNGAALHAAFWTHAAVVACVAGGAALLISRRNSHELQ